MGGALGGLLWVFDVLGGILLWLFIGQSAWKDKSNARFLRVVIGGMLIGALVAVLCVSVEAFNRQLATSESTIWIAFIGAGFVLAMILEAIRQAID